MPEWSLPAVSHRWHPEGVSVRDDMGEPMTRFVILTLVGLFAVVGATTSEAQQPARLNADRAAPSEPIDAPTRAAVLAARDAIWRAWFAHDTAALRRLLPRSTTAGGDYGYETRDEIIAGSQRSAASGRRLVRIRFDGTRMCRNGDVVVVLSSYTMELEEGGKRNTVTGRASEVFVKADGIWQNPFWYLGPP